MRLPIGQHGFGKEAQVSGPGHWSVGMWLERRLRGVQVYFSASRSQVQCVECHRQHQNRRPPCQAHLGRMLQSRRCHWPSGQDGPALVPKFSSCAHSSVIPALADHGRCRRPVANPERSAGPARAAALHVALGLAGAPPIDDDPLPPFWHQIYFWTPRPVGALGVDGHTALGGLIPDMGLPRRMWAGGALEFRAPLVIGQKAEKQTRLISATRKTGRSGPLGFVRLEHRLMQGSEVRVVEQQDLVFRAAPAASDPAPTFKLAPDATESKTAQFNELTLFRYSALTLNGHRIHYDAPYAASEGYGGLVVNGPLLAQLLAGWAAEKLGVLKWFSFRASSPLFVQEAATLGTDGARFWVAGPDGRLCMMAEAA